MFRNQYQRKPKKGVTIKGNSKTDISQQADSDIYSMFEKYKIAGVIPQTKAGEYLMIDTTITGKMTLDEAIREKNNFNEYYASLPAKVRKVFGDNAEHFYQKYKAGEVDEFVNYGILNQQQVNLLKEQKEAVNVEKMENSNQGTTNSNESTTSIG